MNTVYLDNSATTALSETVKSAMTSAMEVYGNPSSLHFLGNAAHDLLESSRADLAKTLGIKTPLAPGQIVFTSCGSEADQLAVLGTAYAKSRRRGMKIITTDSEHPAVEKQMQLLESQGFKVERIPTKGGVLDLDVYEKALDDRVMLVSMMMVNNETGAAYDVATAFRMAKDKNPDIVTHTDAVQGFLKCRFTPATLHADLVSISGHKIHGPKGVGALIVSKDALRRRDFIPTLLGGGQENGFRSGTENLLGIVGLCVAAKEGFSRLDENLSLYQTLREETLKSLSPLGVRFHLPKEKFAPHILNFAVPGIKSETLLHELSKEGICISNGSACSSHDQHPSTALQAFGLSTEEIISSVRVSFSEYNTTSDVHALASALENALSHLVRIR